MAIVLIILQITGSPFLQNVPTTVLGTGGPDAYGYRWIDSDTAGGPTYNWIDISGIGTQITGLADDNVVGPFPIGFDFPYYWYTVNSFFVGSNGYIAFGDNTLEAAPFPTIPNPAKPNNLLAALMSDLDFTAGSPSAYYWTNNAQDTCIIAYYNVQFWNVSSSLNTFEIILSRPDSSITFQYYTQQGVPYGGWSGALTVGIENIAGNVGLQYNHDQQPSNNAIHDSLAVLFYPPDTTSYQVHDMSVSKVMNDISGGFFVYNGDPVDFWALIKNTGNQVESGFDIFCEVRNASNQVVFSDTVNISSINPNETDSLVFSPTWSTTTDGVYSIKVKSLLSGDMVPSNDSIFVEFRVVTYPAELQYDIGYAHTGYAWNGPNSGYGAKFVPPRYPAKLLTARFNVNSTTSNPNVTVQIIDDDGPNGDPGTILYQVVQPVSAAQWYDIDVSSQDIIISSGAFYIGCISDQASDPYFGMDTLFPSGRQSWEYTGSWAPYRDKETQDVLIRAVVELATGVEELNLNPVNSSDIVAIPNPFNKMTAITTPYYTREISIFDVTGRLVRNLKVKNGTAYWDGKNDKGVRLSPGIYFGLVNNSTMLKLILVK